jgi:murein DD-endopeptidase MepM/ murein hydrolase activator NlpD
MTSRPRTMFRPRTMSRPGATSGAFRDAAGRRCRPASDRSPVPRRVVAGPLAVALAVVALAAVPPTRADASPAQAALRTAVTLAELADELRPPSYRLPVDGPVVRPFERPTTVYGPGHRGVDLGAEPGTAVRAAERGRVHHAGQVAGVVWVSIDHRDGVRTSYGPITGLQVRAGDEVERGALLGVLAASDHGDPERDSGLHLGARRDGEYLDPMGLPGIGQPRPSLVGEGGWVGTAHLVTPYDPWGGGRLGGILTTPSPTAERAGFAVPPNPNHLVLVAGLSSSSGTSLLDPSHLGIGADSATRFSYAGQDLDGQALPYGAEATWEGVERAAHRLADQLRTLALQQPGRPVDLLGHSMGGLVIAYYLLHLHDPFDRTLPPIGHVVTVATPHEGSDLARAGVALLDSPGLGAAARSAWSLAGTGTGGVGATARSLTPDAPALRDVATGSDLLVELDAAWAGLHADGSGRGVLATGTRVLSVVASLDGLVGADRAAAEGTERRVLPGTHDGVLATEAVREVVWRFLAGREVVASPGHLTTLVGAMTGTGLSYAAALLGDVDAVPPLPLPGLPLPALSLGDGSR